VAVAVLARARGAPEDDVVAAFLHAGAANLVSAAVRLVPLGQSEGLRALAALAADVVETADASRGADLAESGGACFAADIAAMRHETQYTRLFRS
ncbi:MAG: urease accessory protein UreF, partial [Hyphomicrobiales bacterium]|nr:urease accessory protein UreF [Hyphomicrobiales bacterium]